MAKYRRARHVVCYWNESGGYVLNYASGIQAPSTALVWAVLHFCDDWRTGAHIRREVAPRVGAALAAQILEAMCDASLLESSERDRDQRAIAMERWTGWNPGAGVYHTFSRQVRFTSGAEAEERLRAKALTSRMPPSVKTAAGRRTISLPFLSPTPFSRLAEDRRTWRQFGRGAVGQRAFGRVLRTTSGITHWLTIPDLGEVPLTTSPSGGSRHPIETYVYARRVRGVSPGVYRYASDRHQLDLIRLGASSEEIAELLPHQPWFSDAAFLVFFAAVFERTHWRYESARAYRAVLLEAGHMCQTFLLASTAEGLAPFCTMATDDAAVERLVEIDGVAESVLYAAGAGTRPRTADRVVLSETAAAATVRAHDIQQARRAESKPRRGRRLCTSQP